MISENCVIKIKESAVTHEIVGSLITLKKKGVDYVACCPFHNEKTPSFSVSPVLNKYKCFGCGKSGDGITFLMEQNNLPYIEALKWVAERNNIEIEEVGTKKQIVKPLPRLEKISAEFIDYFEGKRKISNNTLLRFNITETFEWMPKAKAEVKAICFNYYKDEKLVNIKFRGANKDFKLSKDAELIFYNIDSLKNETEIYITEGEIDAMSLYEAGIFNVISVPNGGAVSANQKLEYLDNCYEYFNSVRKIVLFTDNDKTGLKLREELARRLGFDKCYIIEYPDGCKDANDILVKHGKSALLSIASSALRYPLYGEKTMDEMFATVSDYYLNGYPVGAKTGISEDLDTHISFMEGQLTIVTGIPGCFTKEQKVHTSTGVKDISEIKINDKVLSYNHRKRINEFKLVTNTIKHETHTDRLFKIKLKDGTVIKVTENHEFFNGMDYVKIKDLILPLLNANKNMENDT